jgi:hypothetical protein
MPGTSGQEEDEERRDHREREQRRQVGERQETRDDASQNERAQSHCRRAARTRSVTVSIAIGRP